jgi:hypothetical protein
MRKGRAHDRLAKGNQVHSGILPSGGVTFNVHRSGILPKTHILLAALICYTAQPVTTRKRLDPNAGSALSFIAWP